MYRSRIAGIGAYLPEKLLTNYDLEKMMETSHDWIVKRTGIVNRHIVDPKEGTSDLCVRACQQAIKDANISLDDIDMLLVATVSGDYRMPATACIIQAKLGMKNIMAFDIAAACSGFIYGLNIADQFIRTGAFKNILVVGAESLSRLLDYGDRETSILFGDAAGAWVVQRTEAQAKDVIMTAHSHADGHLYDLLWVPGGGTRRPFDAAMLEDKSHYMIMNGKEIFKNAVRTMVQCSLEALESAQLSLDQIDWVIPHQANVRIIEAVADYLKFPMEKVICYVHETANTSAASIPVAFEMAVKEGKIKRGQTILLTAFGAGLTSGSLVFKY